MHTYMQVMLTSNPKQRLQCLFVWHMHQNLNYEKASRKCILEPQGGKWREGAQVTLNTFT